MTAFYSGSVVRCLGLTTGHEEQIGLKVKLTKRFDITPDVDDRINRWVRESHDRLREIHSLVYCGDFIMIVYEETILNEAEAVVEAAEEIIKQTLEEPKIPDLPREDLNLP